MYAAAPGRADERWLSVGAADGAGVAGDVAQSDQRLHVGVFTGCAAELGVCGLTGRAANVWAAMAVATPVPRDRRCP